MSLRARVGFLAFSAAMLPSFACAHVGQGDVMGGLLAGFQHPLLGVDHVVAMVAVGLWGAQLGRPAIWVLPITFPLVMAIGGALGVVGVPLPAVEVGIAISGVVLGAMVAFAVRPPLVVAAVIIAIFAVFHGYAHGTELPKAANAVSYAFGFVATTGFLHALGILIGTIKRFAVGAVLLRLIGAVIAVVGAWGLIRLLFAK